MIRNGSPERAFPIELDSFQRVGIVILEGETNLPKRKGFWRLAASKRDDSGSYT
jgi:hypothetical protein